MAAARKYKVRTTLDWDPNRVPMIEGKITEKGHFDVPTADGKKKEKRNFVVIATDETLFRVWISNNLQEMFESAEAGDMVNIAFGGEKNTKSGRRVKKFAVQLWSE